jgi:ABC-type glycerol-3-phosphate transport system substrate-binding protein
MAMAVLAGVSALAIAACSSEPAAKLVGAQVDDYMLVDQNGMGHILKYDTHTPAVVLMSYVNGDEGARAAAKTAQEIAAKNPDVVFHLINSSTDDTREAIAAEAKEQGITLPLLDDEYQLIGNSVGFSYAGEAVIVNPQDWKVLFHGPASAL